MTLLDSRPDQSDPARRDDSPQQSPQRQSGASQGQQSSQNVGRGERAVSVAAGSILAALGLGRRSGTGLLVAAVGGAMLYRGVTGHCHAYQAMGLNTNGPQSGGDVERDLAEHGIHVEQSFLINRSPEDLYGFWRNFENLPRIMSHLESVRKIDDRKSHWVAKGHGLANKQIEWDAEITQDEPNKLISWRSLPSADIENAGRIQFNPAMGDRGTEVHVFIDYVPPAGRIGHWIASMLGQNPRLVVREDLRNFKRIMEIGELPTIIGQPCGTCKGQGKRYTESQWKPLFT